MIKIITVFMTAARIMLASPFIVDGFIKALNFNSAQLLVQKIPFIQESNSAAVLLGLIVFQILAGLVLVIGSATLLSRLSAILLAFLSFFMAFLLYPFWSNAQGDQLAHSIDFIQNLAITGGLLFFAIAVPRLPQQGY